MRKWKDIPGYESQYCVSDDGLVYSYKRRKRLSSSRDRDGYLRVRLYKENEPKMFIVSRLILLAFVGPCPEGFAASHLDGNPSRNHLSNLTWESQSSNIRRKKSHGTIPVGEKHSHHKLTEKQAKEILAASGQSGGTKLAKKFCVTPATVCDIQKGRCWKHLSKRAK